MSDVMRRLGAVGATVTHDLTSDLLLINGEYSASNGALALPTNAGRVAARRFRAEVRELERRLEDADERAV